MSIVSDLNLWFGDSPTVILDAESESDSIRWSARKRIYLEGATDYEIIAIRWFNTDEGIEFKPGGLDSGGGCSWVIKQVNEQPGTYGIVDRDSLLSHNLIEAFFEADPYLFTQHKPFGSNILVLSHHELENFLIDPSTLLRVLKNRQRQLDGNICIDDPDSLCTTLLEIACLTKSIDSIFKVFSILGLPKPQSDSTGFCCGKTCVDDILQLAPSLFSKEALALAKSIRCTDPGSSVNSDDILSCFLETHEELCKLYNLFDFGETTRSRFGLLIKIIDGKRFLHHLQSKFRIKDPIQLDLADWLAYNGLIPDEIFDFITLVKST